MRVPIEWAEAQFRALGRRDAHDLAVSLIAAYEGSALLANTFRDPNILAREARHGPGRSQWLMERLAADLGNRSIAGTPDGCPLHPRHDRMGPVVRLTLPASAAGYVLRAQPTV
jgi:hypothetical protein